MLSLTMCGNNQMIDEDDDKDMLNKVEEYKYKTSVFVNTFDAERKLKDLNRNFWTSWEGQLFIKGFIYKIWKAGDITYSEFEKIFIDHLSSVFGPDIAEFIYKLLPIEGFKDHLWDLFLHVQLLKNNTSCIYGAREVTKDLTWLSVYAVITYYAKFLIGADAIADFAADQAEYCVRVNKIDYQFCEMIHDKVIIILEKGKRHEF